MMRILADMGISPNAMQSLRDQGYDAVHLRDQGLQRMADSDVLHKAASEGRVLLTCDMDFGHLMAVSGATIPSVVLFRLTDMKPQNVLSHLQTVLQKFSEEISDGAVVVVTDTRIRVRRLPIGQE